MTIQAVVTHSPFVVRRRTPGDSFDLIARQETMSQTLLIPGLSRLNPNKLFAQGQPGGWADPYDLTRMWVDDAGTTPMTLANLGTGPGRVVTKGNAITLTQANAADRPVWGRHPVSGIRNLLERTEDFANAYWTKDLSTISGQKLIPNNGSTLAAAGNGAVGVTIANISSQIYSASIRAKAAEFNRIRFRFFESVSPFAQVNCTVSLVDGSVVTAPATSTGFTTATVSVTAESDGWFRIVISGTYARTANLILNAFAVDSVATTGNGTSGILIDQAQFQAGPIGTYQRVTNRFDITEVGSPSLYYFSGNGVNQRWASNAPVDFSGVDNVTTWAGVERLSDAARGTIFELTASTDANNGAFHMTGPNAASGTYGWESKGTTVADVVVTSALSARRSLVGVGDISGDLARLIVDGVVTDDTGDQGSGNYSNATLNVFSRGGASQFFNGRLYSLIIAGGLYDSRTIQRFADWTLKPRRLITA